MTDTVLTREPLLKALSTSIVKLKFLKKDGTIREMRATTQTSYVEPLLKPADPNKPERKKNPNVQAVVDVDKNEFRSFTWDSLLSWGEDK